MIHDYKAKSESKIQLSKRMIFVSFIDANEALEMHTKSDKIAIMSGIETEDVINTFLTLFVKDIKKDQKQK